MPSTTTVPQTSYRIEERYHTPTGDETIMSISTWDREPLTAESGWELLNLSRLQHPHRYLPYGPYRLVLVGPKHRVLPVWPSWAPWGSAIRAALQLIRRQNRPAPTEPIGVDALPMQPEGGPSCEDCWAPPGSRHELSCAEVSVEQFKAFIWGQR